MGSLGGGGGGAGSIAEDLAELFKLEMDKMANQYETNQRAMQQNADQQIDELAEKLKELARRQEQELQRQRQAAGQNSRDARGASCSDNSRSRPKRRLVNSNVCHASRIDPTCSRPLARCSRRPTPT